MAFFDLPSDEELTPEVRQTFAEFQRVMGKEVPAGWRAFGRSPKITKARFTAFHNLLLQCSSPWEVRNFAWMLIAHAERCQVCFSSSRSNLNSLGWNEATLDQICANPETLPLKERDRVFVQYALKIATRPADLQVKDIEEMEARGLSKDEIQETIGFAAYVRMHMTFTLSQAAWLAED